MACKRWVVRKWLRGTPLTMAVGANWRVCHTKWATQIRPLTGQEGDLGVFTDRSATSPAPPSPSLPRSPATPRRPPAPTGADDDITAAVGPGGPPMGDAGIYVGGYIYI